MSTAARAEQFAVLFQRFWSQGVEGYLGTAPPYSDYDGPNVEECKALLHFLRITFEPLISTRELHLVGHSALNNLQGTLQNLYNAFDQLNKSRDQGSYQNFANSLDAFCNQTRMHGVPLLAIGGTQIEAARTLLQSELERAQQNNNRIEELSEGVRKLITPAVAGSLSAEFSARRDTLTRGRLFWLGLVLALGCAATYATYDLVTTVAASLPRSSAQPDVSFWALAFLRTLFIIPILAGFGFAFAQYRKEREFEEDYAHKAAVAQSLPNYGDLAREGAVRDQIVTAATSVIFVSPTDQAKRLERGNAMLGEMKEVIEVLSKAAGRK